MLTGMANDFVFTFLLYILRLKNIKQNGSILSMTTISRQKMFGVVLKDLFSTRPVMISLLLPDIHYQASEPGLSILPKSTLVKVHDNDDVAFYCMVGPIL